MVPEKSQISPKVPNFAFVELFQGRSQIQNPVLEGLVNPYGQPDRKKTVFL